MTDIFKVWRRPDGYISSSCIDHRQAIHERVGTIPSGWQIYGLHTEWRPALIQIWEKRLAQGWQPDFDNGGQGPHGVRCEAFILCDNPAEYLIDHPTLVKYPSCVRCMQRLGHAVPQ